MEVFLYLVKGIVLITLAGFLVYVLSKIQMRAWLCEIDDYLIDKFNINKPKKDEQEKEK